MSSSNPIPEPKPKSIKPTDLSHLPSTQFPPNLPIPTPNPNQSSSTPPTSKRHFDILRVLTATQNTSALVFSVFLTVHLASPLAAAIGGGGLADKTMMIAGDLYLPLEPLLVYIPLSLHLTSSLTKRLILISRTKRLPKPTNHIIAGYALLPFILPHILIHRLIPQSPVPPISSLSPSEFGWEFVGWSIYTYPISSILGYIGIVTLGSLHAGIGGMKIVSWLIPRRLDMGLGVMKGEVEGEAPRRVVSRKRKVGLRGILVGLIGIVGVGLGRLYGEAAGKGVGGFMEGRYREVYRSLPFGQVFLR